MRTNENMCTQECLDAERKVKNGRPQQLSPEQVRFLRAEAADRAQSQAESTTPAREVAGLSELITQAQKAAGSLKLNVQTSKAAGSCEPTIQAPTTSPAPPDSAASLPPPMKAPKMKKKAPAKKSTQGGEGGQDAAGVQGAPDTRVIQRHPYHTLHIKTPSDGTTEWRLRRMGQWTCGDR
jgi:hypothetical protein